MNGLTCPAENVEGKASEGVVAGRPLVIVATCDETLAGKGELVWILADPDAAFSTAAALTAVPVEGVEEALDVRVLCLWCL